MTDNQIIRIPVKYSELLQTMNNEDAWKLIKALFAWKSDWLSWLTLTYYNIIIVDIINIQKQVNIWRKSGILWWRPKQKGGVIENKRGGLLKTKPKISKDKLSKVKISKDKLSIKHKYWEYQNVLLTDKQKDKLIEDFWESMFYKYLKIVDEYIQVSWKVYKDHNLVMRKFKNNDKNKKEINHASDTWVVLAPKVF